MEVVPRVVREEWMVAQSHQLPVQNRFVEIDLLKLVSLKRLVAPMQKRRTRMSLHLADTRQRPKCAKWLLVQKIRVGSLNSLALSYIRWARLFLPRDFLRASRRFASSSFPDRIDFTAGINAD